MNAYLWNYFYALNITAIAAFLLGGFILLKDPNRFTNRIFAIFLFCIFIWAFFQSWLGIADNEEAAMLSQRLEHIGILLIPILYLHFILALLGLNKIPKEKFLLRLNYAISLFFIISIPSYYFMEGLNTSGPLKFSVRPGVIYPYSTGWFILVVVYAIYKLFKASFQATGRLRIQARWLFWSALIGYGGGAPNYLYVYSHPLPIINPFFTYGVFIHVVLTTYCIVKHRLFDIQVTIKNTVIYGLIYSFAIGIFVFLVIFFGQWLVYGSLDQRVIWMCMVSLIFITAMVRPLDTFLTKLTDKILFRKKYEYQKTLRAVSSGMATVRDLNELLNLIITIITEHVRVTHATMYLNEGNDLDFRLRASEGRSKLSRPLRLTKNDPIVEWLNKEKDALIYDSLDFITNDFKERGEIDSLKKQLDELKTDLCVPCLFENKLIGFLFLGKKLSGDIYTQEDIDIFMTLANHAASAIENCWAYEELKEKEKLLVEAEKLAAVGRLASNIAHEIKNPLAPIKTYTEFLDEKIDDPKFRSDFKKVILEETNRINHIVEQLINYGHPKKLNKSEVDIRQILENTLHLLENDLKKENIQVRQDYASTSQTILADPQQLKQVFLNIFLNSIQAMDKVTERPKEIRISTILSDDTLTVRIQDTGCGIKKEELPFIFDPFFSTKDKGSGLGLSIVQSIIKNHGGVILAESQLNEGTTFRISLPRGAGGP